MIDFPSGHCHHDLLATACVDSPWNEVGAGGNVSLVPCSTLGPLSFWENSQTQTHAQVGNPCPEPSQFREASLESTSNRLAGYGFYGRWGPKWGKDSGRPILLYSPCTTSKLCDHVLSVMLLYVPGPVPEAWQKWTPLILITTWYNRYYYHLHRTDKDIQAQRGKAIAHLHIPMRWSFYHYRPLRWDTANHGCVLH